MTSDILRFRLDAEHETNPTPTWVNNMRKYVYANYAREYNLDEEYVISEFDSIKAIDEIKHAFELANIDVRIFSNNVFDIYGIIITRSQYIEYQLRFAEAENDNTN